MKARNLLLLVLLGAFAACQPNKSPSLEMKAGAATQAEPAPKKQPAEKPVATAPADEPAPVALAPATEPKPAAKPMDEKPKTAKATASDQDTHGQQRASQASTSTKASISAAAAAVAMPAEAGKCKACHAIDKKLVGPSWKEVAVRRNGDKAVILANIKKGGKLGWGMGNMPPNGTESDAAKLEKLAAFIAGLK